MARIRSVKPEYFDDPDIGQLSAEAALAFIGLWTQADREGRLIDDPRRLKVRLRPFSSCDFDAILAELVDAGFVIRYQSEHGARLLQVRTFAKHQRCHKDEKDSELPAPKRDCGVATVKPGNPPAKTPVSGLWSLVSGPLELEGGAEPSADDSDPTAGVVMVFPTTGKGPKTWALKSSYVAELAGDYPGLDVLGECRKARAWCVANERRRKTANGMPSFLVSWFNKAVRDGGQRVAAVSRPAPFEPQVDWFEECKAIHKGACGLDRHRHAHRKAMDADAASQQVSA